MLAFYPFRFLLSNINRCFNVPSDPFLINYSVTFRCNLDCKYCGVSKMKKDSAGKELTYKDISIFLKDNKLKKLDAIVISGGEPFLKEDLIEILLEFKKNISPRIFHITTNGYLTDKITGSMEFLKKKGLNIDLKVSIDDIAHKHDLLRGRENSFKNAVATIDKLRNMFTRRQLFIGINQTIFEDNYKSIPGVKKLAKNLNVSYRGFVGFKKRPLYSDSIDTDYALVDLSNEAKECIRHELKNSYIRIRGLSSYLGFMDEVIIEHYIKGQINMLNNTNMNKHKCMNIFTHFRLNPNGDIITCSYDLDILGNIKENSYASILRKEIVAKKIKKIKECGKCWLGCEVSPNWVSSLFAF